MAVYFGSSYYFLVPTILVVHIGLTTAVSFEKLLNLFNFCDVKLHNYQNIPFSISLSLRTPVTIQTHGMFNLKKEGAPSTRVNRPPRNIRSECQASFHIHPDNLKEKAHDWYRSKLKKSYRRDLPPPSPSGRTSQYDVIVDKDLRMLTTYTRDLKIFVNGGTPSHWLIALTRDMFSGQFDLQIVNKLKLSSGKLVTVSLDVTKVWGLNHLTKKIEGVNDLRNNRDVGWTLQKDTRDVLFPKWGSIPKEKFLELGQSLKDEADKNGDLMEDLTRHGKLKMATAGRYLKATSGVTEGREDYVFARMALGENVTLGKGPGPRITFHVNKARLMAEEKHFGFVSCARTGRRWSREPGVLYMLVNLVAVFTPEVWFGILLTYVVAPVILGVLYHGLLKKRIIKKYWVKWHPFTWGLRALIRQAGDRILNRQRFGWTIWITGPLLLMAVVITYAFLNNNIPTLYRVFRYRGWVDLGTLQRDNASLVTDHQDLGEGLSPINMSLGSYQDLAEEIGRNESIALVTYDDRAREIAKRVRGHFGGKGYCPGGGEVKQGGIWWAPYGLPWRVRQMFYQKPRYGWVVQNGGDDRLIRRLKVLEGGSGIVKEWREMIKLGSDREGNYWERWGSYVTPIAMMPIFWKVWAVGLFCLGGAIVVWILERLMWKLWTEPRRRRMAKKKEREEAEKKGEDKRGSVVDGVQGEDVLVPGDLGENLAERRRSSAVSAITVRSLAVENMEDDIQECPEVGPVVEMDAKVGGSVEEDRNSVKKMGEVDNDSEDESALGTELNTLDEIGSDFEESETVSEKNADSLINIPGSPSVQQVPKDHLDVVGNGDG